MVCGRKYTGSPILDKCNTLWGKPQFNNDNSEVDQMPIANNCEEDQELLVGLSSKHTHTHTK